ncbi:hypothetical protein NSU_0244 [Novosphingobium pentaromativorans US6-1]|uniref:Uncharacterized protein n=1 Tax=Novosphingobium pentaromativorans US6-1 TaxID=1088721 RepID=G6E7A8_9SPHN|nr:hypothetical protein NSU_0244 [Novosphingobium pentaromativorans US6-1]
MFKGLFYLVHRPKLRPSYCSARALALPLGRPGGAQKERPPLRCRSEGLQTL